MEPYFSDPDVKLRKFRLSHPTSGLCGKQAHLSFFNPSAACHLMDGVDHIIPLGSFCIAHKPSHLQLDVAISISARQRLRGQFPGDISSPLGINDLLRAWVCRGAGLKLKLQIDGHGCHDYNALSDDDHVDLWAAVCQQICHAEVSVLSLSSNFTC